MRANNWEGLRARLELQPNGCIEYKGMHFNGYAMMNIYHINAPQRVHRVMYLLFKGAIPEQLDHLCRNRGCVNVDHLEPVSNKENHNRGGNTGKMRKIYVRNGRVY